MTPDANATFLPPDRATLDRIVEDEALQRRYTTALALIHDVICDYSDAHPHRRFLDRALLARKIKGLLMLDPPAEPDPADRAAIENLRINLRRALALRKRARATARTAERKSVRSGVAAFLDAMTAAFGEVLKRHSLAKNPSGYPAFIAPDRATLDRFAEDRAIQGRYHGALRLIYECLCDFTDDHRRRKVEDLAELGRQLKGLLMLDPPAEPDPADRAAIENLRANRRRALALRRRARATARTDQRGRVRSEVTYFLDGLVATAGDVDREAAERSPLSKAKGA